MQSNAHPADRLAGVRAEIRNLEEEEASLRRYLLEHEEDRIGDEYVAQIGTWPQRRIDLKGLMGEIGEAVLRKFTTKLKVPTIRLKPRETPED
jgi:hypothetical protein